MPRKRQDQRKGTAGRDAGRSAKKRGAGGARGAGDEAQLPSNTVKDPEDWITGDERMTGAQASYLKTLSDEAGEPFDEALTKAQASERIEELQRRTGRGQPAS